ncbi:MAG TPA: tetratricopeptide repeat protein [Myxococcales bacterium]|jgi:tetratricopeptide (TPR) repeat protein
MSDGICGTALREAQLLQAGAGDRKKGALVLAQAELAEAEKRHAPTSPQLARPLLAVAAALHDLDCHEEADGLEDRAIALMRQWPVDEALASELYNLGLGRLWRKRPSSAVDLLAWAAPVARQLPAKPWFLDGLLKALGDAHRDLGQWDQARAAFEEALSAARSRPQPAGWIGGALILRGLASVAIGRGDLPAAESLLREALAEESKAQGEGYWEVAEVLDELAQVLRSRGDVEGALMLEGQALEILAKYQGPRFEQLAQALRARRR